MKRTILFLGFLACILFVFGQGTSSKFDIKWGQTVKINKKFIFEDVITIDEKNNIHVLYAEYSRFFPSGVKYHSAKIGSSLNLIQQKELNLNLDGQIISLSKIVESGGNPHFFFTASDNKAKIKSIYLYIYNPENLSLSNGKLIARFSFEGYKKSRGGEFRVSYSENRNHLLVFYSLPFEDKDPERFGVIVLDKDLNEEWKNEFTLKYTSDRFVVQDVFVANNGEMNITAKKYNDKASALKRDPRFYNYVLLNTMNSGTEMAENEISLKDYYISDMAADVNSAGDIICSGFITEKAKSQSIKGVFYITIDQSTGLIETKTVKEFDFDILTYGMSERQQNKAETKISKGKDVEMPGFVFRDFIIKQNGGALLTAEEYYVWVSTTTDPRTGATTTSYHYYYNEIIVIDINPDGSINWVTIVPKLHYSMNDFGFYSSYFIATRSDKVYLMFTDHIENLKNLTPKQRVTATRNLKKKYVAIVTIDNRGKWTKEMLFPVSAKGIPFLPTHSLQLSEDEILLYCYKRKANKFGIAKLK